MQPLLSRAPSASALRFTPRVVALKRPQSQATLPSSPVKAPGNGVAVETAAPQRTSSVLATEVPLVGSPSLLTSENVSTVCENTLPALLVCDGASHSHVEPAVEPPSKKVCRGTRDGTSSGASCSSDSSSCSSVEPFSMAPDGVSSAGTASQASSRSSSPPGPPALDPEFLKVPTLDDMFCDDPLSPVSRVVPSSVRGSSAAPAALPVGPAVPALEAEDGWDDGDGYYKACVGEVMGGRYRVVELVGSGMFSTVVRAVDTTTATGVRVAIKIIRANDMMARAAEKEASLLGTLAAKDPEARKRCIRLLGSFSHRKHTCLVFESMEMDLRKLNKQVGGGVGLSMNAVRLLGRQLFVALRHLHSCEHVHADVKPDNILIGGVDGKRNLLKLADFGTAVPFWELPEYAGTRYMQSRYYRAPEVILGGTRSPAMDVWSAGVVLFELFTGKFCFDGANNLEVLRSMAAALGPVPARVLKASPFRDTYYMPDRDVLLAPTATSGDVPTGPQVVGMGVTDVKSRLTRAAIKGKVAGVKAKHPRNAAKIEAARTLSESERAEVGLLCDLLGKVFVYDPAKRLTAEQALRHEFFVEPRTSTPAMARRM